MMQAEQYRFFLGVHEPSRLWNYDSRHALFVSVRRLQRHKKWKPSRTDWSMDSGGFTELSMYGEWRTSPELYVEMVARAISDIGRLQWAAPQDWMCEPHMIEKTGRSVVEHQHLTCENFLRLRELAPDLPIIPSLQGWNPDDYRDHVEMYLEYGVDLRQESTVGMGSFCRRAKVSGVAHLVRDLHAYGLRMHGFGLKRDGLELFRNHLASSDSMAWCMAGWYEARNGNQYPCGTAHPTQKNCVNCHDWAQKWADSVVSCRQRPEQLDLWDDRESPLVARR